MDTYNSISLLSRTSLEDSTEGISFGTEKTVVDLFVLRTT